MPSSPVTDPISPPAREFVEFGKKRRTLEWACAAARLAEKDGARPLSVDPITVSRASSRTRTRERQPSKLDLEITDDEEDQLVTPPGTWGDGDRRWTSDPRGSGAIVSFPPPNHHESSSKHIEDDDEIMKAALALCGLQNRRHL